MPTWRNLSNKYNNFTAGAGALTLSGAQEMTEHDWNSISHPFTHNQTELPFDLVKALLKNMAFRINKNKDKSFIKVYLS